MGVIIGSARIGENGSITNGRNGDQKQTSTQDYNGEVSMQSFYVHKKGWYVLKPKSAKIARSIAQKMQEACNNKHLGYDQTNRYGVIKYGINTNTDTECDCSSLVRACVKEASGIDPGDFNTSTEISVLKKTGLFEQEKRYTNGMILTTGSILCTCSKGHTAIVVSGADPDDSVVVVDSCGYPEPTYNLRRGSTGEGVKWLQYYLNKNGSNLIIDGEFGPKTGKSLKDFQRMYGLVVDEICGPATRAKIKQLFG